MKIQNIQSILHTNGYFSLNNSVLIYSLLKNVIKNLNFAYTFLQFCDATIASTVKKLKTLKRGLRYLWK